MVRGEAEGKRVKEIDLTGERRKSLGLIGRIYEDLCNVLGKLFTIDLLDQRTKEDFQKAIAFSNLNTTPEKISTAIIFIILLSAFVAIALFLLGNYTTLLSDCTGLNLCNCINATDGNCTIEKCCYWNNTEVAYRPKLCSAIKKEFCTSCGRCELSSLSALIPLGIFLAGVCFSLWFFYYPTILARSMVVKQNAEGIQAILYMTIALRSGSNLENAVSFAAANLHGPMGYSLKKAVWQVYSRQYNDIKNALMEISQKWRFENKEFTESLNLIISSIDVTSKKKESMLDEALNIVLGGTEEKMKHYSSELRTPVMMLNTMGILLPLIGMSLLPIVVVFMSEQIKPASLILIYNIILPIAVYVLIKLVLHKRPWTFTQPNIEEHPDYVPRGSMRIAGANIPVLPIALIVSALLIATGLSLYYFYPSESTSIYTMLFSVVILFGISSGISIYLFGSTYQNMKIIEDTKTIEAELSSIFFKLGSELYKGEPLERAISVSTKEKELKSSSLFEKVSQNIKMFGMTLEQALLDKKQGAIRYFPSTLTKSVMKVISESSKKGQVILSNTLMTISEYLGKVHAVEERLKEVLDESISEMSFQSTVLTPVVTAIVMAMIFVMVAYLATLQAMFEKIDLGAARGIVDFSTSFFLDVSKIISLDKLQLIIGIYVIETVWVLSTFQSLIEYGEEETTTNYTIGKNLFTAIVLYSIILIIVSLIFHGMLSLMGSAVA